MPSPRRKSFRAKLGVETLEGREVPAFLSGSQIVVGADAGAPPLVRIIDANTQTVDTQLLVFGGNFYGGVRVAVGDVNGDGVPDLIAAAGPSGGPIVQVFSGTNGAMISSFYAYPQSFTGGVNVAVGDVNGDGKDEIITGTGAGGGPIVSVFDGSGNSLGSFYAYAQNFRGGVRVAAADTNGDGTAEIVTAPGYGGGPDVRIYQFASGQGTWIGGITAFPDGFNGGLYLAAGDLTGDGKAEIIVGAGYGGGPLVKVFTGDGQLVDSYFAYDPSFRGGVRVAVADMTGDGLGDVLTAAGPGGGSQVNVYDSTSSAAALSVFGFPASQLTGSFVAGSGTPLTIPSTPADLVSNAYSTLQNLVQNGQSVVPVVQQVQVVVFNGVYPFFPFGFGPGFGLGFGGLYGGGFYDAPGLYAPVGNYYGSSFFGSGYYGNPTYLPAPNYYGPNGQPIDPGFFDQNGYPTSPGYLDPGPIPPAVNSPELLPAPIPVLGPPQAVAGLGGLGNYGTGGLGANGLGGYSLAGLGGSGSSLGGYGTPVTSIPTGSFGGSGGYGGYFDYGGSEGFGGGFGDSFA